MCYSSISLLIVEGSSDFTPADKSEVVLYSSAHGDLVPDVGAHWLGQLYAHGLAAHADHLASKRLATHVDHQQLIHLQWTDLCARFGAFLVGGLCFDTEQPPQEFVGHVYLAEDVWHFTWMSDDLANEVIASGDERINLHSDTDEAAWDGIHQLVFIGLQGDDLALNLFPLDCSSPAVLGDQTRPDGNEVSNL